MFGNYLQFTRPGPTGGGATPASGWIPSTIPSAPIAGVANSPFIFPAPGGMMARVRSVWVQYTLNAVPVDTILFGNAQASIPALISQAGNYTRVGNAHAMLSTNAQYLGMYMDARLLPLVNAQATFNWSVVFPDWMPTVFAGNGQVAYAEVETQ